MVYGQILLHGQSSTLTPILPSTFIKIISSIDDAILAGSAMDNTYQQLVSTGSNVTGINLPTYMTTWVQLGVMSLGLTCLHI